MFLVLFVLHKSEKLEDLLNAWEEVGVSKVTILHSSGLGRLRRGEMLDDLPLIPSLEALMEHQEQFSRTMFTVIEDEALVEPIVAAAESVVGNLSRPDTGLLLVLPVARAYGLKKSQPLKGERR